jgi:ABC-type transporter Mla subunit MlaD
VLGGGLVALVLVAGVWLAWKKPDPFAHPRHARIMFSDAGALAAVGADVRVAGTPVGKVTGRHRAGNAALVDVELSSGAPALHADASAELRPRLAFEGTAFVDLHPGSPAAPPLGDATIPLARTRVYVPLDRVLRIANQETRARLRGTIDGLALALEPRARRAVRGTLGRAPALLRDLESTARAAQGPGEGALRRAVAVFATTAHAVAARDAELAPLARAAARTAAALHVDGGAPLRRALDELPATAASLAVGGAALDATLARLAPLARMLVPGARALAPTLASVRPLLREGANALVGARPLLADVRAGLRASAPAARPARTLLRALAPTLAVLRDSLLPALRRNGALGLPAYDAFLNMFEGGGGSSRFFQTPAQGGSMGAGHFMRFGFRFLTGIGAPLPPCTLLQEADPALAAAASKAGACTP